MYTRKVVAALAASGALALASMLGTGATVLATGNSPHQVTLCHATSSEAHPYIEVTVDLASSGNQAGLPKGGHANHGRDGVWYPGAKADKFNWGDIIPAYDYGAPYVYAGLNLTTAGQAILENGCKVPNEVAESFITTEVHLGATDDGDPVVVDQADPATAGDQVHDSALLEFPSLGDGLPQGSSVTFYFYSNLTCTGDVSGQSFDVSGDKSVVSIDPGTVKGPLEAGNYSFKAVFTSGDTELVANATGACEPFVVSSPSTTSSTTSGGGGGGGGGSSTASLPATLAFGEGSNPNDHTWILIAALGMLLGSALVLAPARVKSRR